MPSNTYTIIEYGSQNIKVLSASKIGKAIKVHRMELLPAPENTIENGAFEDPSIKALTLKKYFASNGIKSKDAIIVLSSPSVMIREFTIPSNKPSMVRNFINVESQQVFPIDISTCTLDYKIGEKVVEDDGKISYNAVVAAVPNEMLEGYVWAAGQAGLNVFSVDISPDCIVKLYNSYTIQSGNVDKKEIYTTAFIDIGASMTNATIAVNDMLKYNKVLQFGSRQITDIIAENDALSSQQAEKAKISYKIPEQFPEGASEKDIRISSQISDFIDDISIFFEFHESRRTANRIDEIILYGGGARLGNLDKYLKKTMNIPIIYGMIFDNIEFDKSIQDSNDLQVMFYNCLGALVNL